MSDGRILVTGATGRLGRAVLTALGDRGIAGVRRREDDRPAILVASDGSVDPAALDGIAAIVNCAGRVDGTPGEIEQANVTYPVALATVARTAGVARFVQVSSFSIFGRTEHIDRDSPLAPADRYGHSKLSAERALHALDAAGFRTLPLRLPFMFSARHPAHLGRLVSLMLRLHVLPTRAGAPSRRSMMTYAGAAEMLATLVGTQDLPDAPAAAADPDPLALVATAQAVAARLDRRIAIVPVPAAIVGTAGAVAPGLANRLFGSSVLAAEANLATTSGPHGVARELDAYLDRLAIGGSAGHHRGT